MMEKISVAIVEDTPETMARFVAAVEAHPQTLTLLHTASTGANMQQWLALNAPDVLLVDLGLPDMSGLNVIRYCRQQCPITDIMVITLFGDERNMMAAFEAGATGYLLKDGSEIEIAQHIEQLHAGGSPMSPSIARQLLKRFRPTPELSAPRNTLLTAREQTLLVHLSQGFSYQELASLSKITVGTVNTHIKSIYRKLEVHSKTEAIFEARQLGILPH